MALAMQIFEKSLPEFVRKWYRFGLDSKTSYHRQLTPRVTKLQESGVKLGRRSSHQFWDIKFNKGVLEIPSLWIQDSTKSILLNLAAFEQCHLDINEAAIASYLVFMECLIKSPEDVSYLNRHGIVQHLLGDDTKVVDMFKSVANEMLTDAHSNRYAKLGDELNTYFCQRKNRCRASLLRNYFNNPWVIISLVAAFFLLLLTVTQTVYTVWPFYRSAP
ncbi:UPF0481 protein At3g47200-like [Silene latifolia]|uniref:UPF0481 protein At3g47200-like n=1 Tax=Silene latifolia TaxID=37657 RepID=UPI003D775A11